VMITRSGEQVSPALTWTNAPPNTASRAACDPRSRPQRRRPTTRCTGWSGIFRLGDRTPGRRADRPRTEGREAGGSARPVPSTRAWRPKRRCITTFEIYALDIRSSTCHRPATPSRRARNHVGDAARDRRRLPGRDTLPRYLQGKAVYISRARSAHASLSQAAGSRERMSVNTGGTAAGTNGTIPVHTQTSCGWGSGEGRDYGFAPERCQPGIFVRVIRRRGCVMRAICHRQSEGRLRENHHSDQPR
jgi:hypothetical protein